MGSWREVRAHYLPCLRLFMPIIAYSIYTTFDKVLLIDEDGAVKVGSPYVEGAVVKATVIDDDAKAKKVLVFKKIRRKGYQTLNGHRQKLTKIHIDAIA